MSIIGSTLTYPFYAHPADPLSDRVRAGPPHLPTIYFINELPLAIFFNLLKITPILILKTNLTNSFITMWRNPATNLLRRAFNLAAVGPARPRPVSSSTNHCYGILGIRFNQYCSAAVGGRDESGGENAMTYAEAKRLMRLVNVESLKEKLGMEEKEVISYDELLKSCESIGLAKTTTEAAAFARVLDEAGVVLLFRDKVYLHPDKVSALLCTFLGSGMY